MTKRIVIWCGDAPNQRALADKIAKQFSVAGIVIEEKNSASPKKKLLQLPAIVWDRLKFASIYKAWKSLQASYRSDFPDWPDTKIFRTGSINNKETADFSHSLSPDIIVVSGTSLIKEPVLSVPASIGIINLHTGLSPYVKGGPNCTNWCIANNDWHLIGNTIMWINAGIDTGNIITTQTIDIRQASSLYEAQKMVMEHAHQLYLKALQYLVNNNAPYNSVSQSDFPKGKTFFTKMWTAQKRSALIRNWSKRKSVQLKDSPKIISLP